MSAALSDFSVNISHKRPVCVLDPTLALSVHGLSLLTRLGEVMDVWIARELWHILDNTHFYLERPELLLATEQGRQIEKSQAMVQTLLDWERIRLENDPARQHCYWVGDSPLESFLPENVESDIIWRYEALSAGLDARLSDKNAPLALACRDAAALAVCLPAAFVLSYLPALNHHESSPDMCTVLDSAGISCEKIASTDVWQQQESDLLRQILVRTGVSKWVWSGLRLAVLQLVAPAACAIDTQQIEEFKAMDYGLNDMDILQTLPAIDYWREARGFWYPL